MKNDQVAKEGILGDGDKNSLLLIIIFATFLPLLLIFLGKMAPSWSIVFEELGKVLVVYFFILKLVGSNRKMLMGFFFGLIFGIWENIFYLEGFIRAGDYDLFLARFLWPLPMHFSTVLLMVMSGLEKRKYVVFGLMGAVLLHYIYNIYITSAIFDSVFLKGLLSGVVS
ncbi:MAG: PrsW family glutamic-type intramembrane protease [Patescibacteria group bacterium]|jgi:RsiW-degrading membrane proteinase PrsW (M82 family)